MDAALRLPPDSRLLAFPSPSPRLPLDRLSPNCLLARGAFTLTYSHSSPTSPPALWRYVRLNSSIKQQKKDAPHNHNR